MHCGHAATTLMVGPRVPVVIVHGRGFMLSFRAMNNDAPPPGAAKRHEQFRKFGAYKNFAEADAQLRAYWRSRTPEERMEALEE